VVAEPMAERMTEIIAVGSGKGGTGKTLILASLGYALQRAGHDVLFIDADTATDGLSLFLLGPRGWEQMSQDTNGSAFTTYLLEYQPGTSLDVTPRIINRGERQDHGQFYNLIVSSRDLYGERDIDNDTPPDPRLARDVFRSAVSELFRGIRNSGKWDYVLVDTRGGFGFSSTDVCALADSFIVVTEPDFTSFYQNRNFIRRVSATAVEHNAQAILRAMIINKAHEGVDPIAEEGDDFKTVDMSRVEAAFRNVVVEEFSSLRYEDTYPIPFNIEAIKAYQQQKLPFLEAPGSFYAFAIISAFKGILRVVTAEWPRERADRWNQLVDQISDSIDVRNIERLARARETEEREQRFAEQEALLAQLRFQLGERENALNNLREQFAREIERQQLLLKELQNKSQHSLWNKLIEVFGFAFKSNDEIYSLINSSQTSPATKANLVQRAARMKMALNDANLGAIDLSGRNLRSINLSAANLKGARLDGADFEGAVLVGANLSRAFMRQANLKSADLSFADLREADLVGARLEGAIFRQTDIRGADLTGAEVERAALRQVIADGETSADPEIRASLRRFRAPKKSPASRGE
jgi:uncharacterized protein YjbI with pentapeptide repeats/MinD-like ATPase involved in chromosome partitioning or flagellar assembly